MVKIYNSGNSIVTQQILELLKENKIPAYKMEVGSGSYLSIMGGMSMTGANTDIYVDETQAEQASELIREMVEPVQEEEQENDVEQKQKPKILRRIIAIVLLVAAIASMIVMAFLQMN